MAKAEFRRTHTEEECAALGLRSVNNTNKDIFTKEEDLLIEELVEERGEKWQDIAEAFPGRSAKDIRNRYHSVHRVRRSGESKAKRKQNTKWTAEEDAIIREGFAEHGNKYGKWTIIANLLGEDRDSTAVKNRAKSTAFKKAAAGSAMAAAASVPATLTNDESTVVVPRAPKKVKVAIPPTCVDGGVAAAASVPATLTNDESTDVVMQELPPLPELAFSSPVPHADIDSFDFSLSKVDFDENDDTVVENLFEAASTMPELPPYSSPVLPLHAAV